MKNNHTKLQQVPTTQHDSRARRTALTALMVSLALIFSYIEFLIPFTPAIPGINLVIIVALYYVGPRYALTVNIVRVLIAGLLFSGVFGAAYSMAGALLSFLVMVLLKKTGLFSITGVSIAGGVAHNLGQILVASFLVSNLKMFAYFPVLIFSGVASGAAIGIISWLILQRLPRS